MSMTIKITRKQFVFTVLLVILTVAVTFAVTRSFYQTSVSTSSPQPTPTTSPVTTTFQGQLTSIANNTMTFQSVNDTLLPIQTTAAFLQQHQSILIIGDYYLITLQQTSNSTSIVQNIELLGSTEPTQTP